jgi:hypothetical protein
VETLMRITLEERTTILPDGDSLELLGVMMGRGSATALHDEVRSAMQHVRPLLTAAARRLQP